MKSPLEFLVAARRKREPLLAKTNAFRALWGDAEGIPGLVVDEYAGVAAFLVYEGRCGQSRSQLSELANQALRQFAWKAVYLKDFLADRTKAAASADLYSDRPVAGEELPERWEMAEHGLRFWIRPHTGYSTGIFLDQRDNRKFLAENASGKKVLNAFSYSCAFSVACAARGASVTSVDLSKKYLNWGRENFELNGLALDSQRFIAEDALTYFKRAEKRKETWDLIIIDPPSFSRSSEGSFSVRKDLPTLLRSARGLLSPGGRIFFSSNLATWSPQEFRREVRASLGPHREINLPPRPIDFAFENYFLNAFCADC